jgi:class 3 adenylate cyclase
MPRNPATDVRGLPTREKFFSTLRRRKASNADDLDRELERRCVRELTIMMCDSSGFSRKTHDYGILQFLAVMTQCYDKLLPVVARHGGSTISHGADNLLAVFPDPAHGADAAIAMQRFLAAHNDGRHDRDQFNLCIGLHHGKILRLKDDVYGDKVNVVAKIGEDLADRDEILATGEAVKLLPSRFKRRYARSVALGGKEFELHSLPWKG